MKTRSEALFECFLSANKLPFEPVPTGLTSTPDYEVTVAGSTIIFEVKELAVDDAFGDFHSQTVGEHIRGRIKDAGKQLREASKAGKATVLLIFNARDPDQRFGTENGDFEHAMYGELTFTLVGGKIVDRFHGRNKAMQPTKNTSFSALGRLKTNDRTGEIRVTPFENAHARVPIAYDRLPECFEAIRFVL